jgi:hypothetical protein
MIHYEIGEPQLSSDFTIDDIHKIREWNYERTKDASKEEYFSYENEQTRQAMKSMGVSCVFDSQRKRYVLFVKNERD